MNTPETRRGNSHTSTTASFQEGESVCDCGRLEEILAEYLLARDSGAAEDQETLIARHPDLSVALRAFFADEARVENLAQPFRPVAALRTDGDDDHDVANAPAHRFGDYELIEEIARGGMGVVFKARQLSLDRTVALKMVLSGQFASAEDVRRFQVEAANAATLTHPNIVPIYEVGCHSRQHYYTMKLIEGPSLAKRTGGWAKDHKAAARLLATIARAIDHAHRHGVLHRDLKPGNILIDIDGQPHVTDFGLARRLEGSDAVALTHSGAVVGSPRYMAPEQAKGERSLTTAVDVYSLGAILYELLTGRPPFVAETLAETLRMVRETEPSRPSLIIRHLDRDLETICLKCLEKEPGARYSSASDVADDLERWLRNEPIIARPVGVWERARKWARRQPAKAALVAVSVLSVMLLVAGLALNNYLIDRERVLNNELIAEERNVTVMERNAKQAALEAEESLRKRAAAALEYLTDDFVPRQLARKDVLGEEDRAFLEKIAAYYEAFASSKAEDLAIQAAGHLRIGWVRERLGESKEARASYQRSIELYNALLQNSPKEPNHRNELVRAYALFGRLLSRLDQREAAQAQFRLGIELGNQLVKEFGDSTVYGRNLAFNHNSLGGLMGKLEEHLGAAAEFRRAIELDERVVDANPTQADFREHLANSYNGLGVALMDLGQELEAEVHLRHAMSLRQRLVEQVPDHPKYRQTLMASHCNLGIFLSGRAAEDEFRRAITIGEELVREFPVVEAYRTRLANAHNGLGVTLAELRNRDAAEAQFRRAIELRTRLLEGSSKSQDHAVRLGTSYYSLGDVLREDGRTIEALDSYQKAIATLAPVAGVEPRLRNVRLHLSKSYIGRAMTLANVERYGDAARDLDALVQLNHAIAPSPEATALVQRAKLLLTLCRVEKVLAGSRCRFIRASLRPCVGTGDAARSIYGNLDWTRARRSLQDQP